jgi:hypothetical protein
MYRALEETPGEEPKYHGLLGDCFLIQLRSGTSESRILIDCGMLMGSPDATERMRAIATDIARTCGYDPVTRQAGKLDLVVVTHEHWDHISGFSQAADIFFDREKLKIDTVWMAWTEDPADDLANELHARFDVSASAFAMIGERLRNERSNLGAAAVEKAIHGLDGFMGLAAAAAKGDKRPRRLIGRDIVKRLRADPHKPAFLRPGEVRETSDDLDKPSLRAFVLGPPRDKKKLFKDKPSTATPETYLDHPSIDGAQLMRFADGLDPDPSRDSPFAPPYCLFLARDIDTPMALGSAPDGDVREFVRARYYGLPTMDASARGSLERRRIDADWLSGAGRLALKLDSDTNNTSLVLAFELPDSERSIMLFAADAQVGNWESWHDQTYPADGSAPPLTAEQILNRTWLYKVGHHGSHNATLRTRGLEMMTSDRLFALIPTDEELGNRQGSKGWQMPNSRVQAALRERTKGRILRNDRSYSPEALKANPDVKGEDADLAFFDERLTETPLFLEYRLLPERKR